jgi:hypothetical protein
MGLDMHLYRKHYVKNWDHMRPEERHAVSILKNGKPTSIKPERICHITEEVGYWRKANAIHRWFVENVQDGSDDCNEYYVSREKLQELLSLCKRVIEASKLVPGKIANGYHITKNGREPIMQDGNYIKNPGVAKKLLPPQNGFFFGSTNYDQYYFSDLQDTVKLLTDLLNEPDKGAIYYQSSW